MRRRRGRRATTSGRASTRCACCAASSTTTPERASRPMSASAGGFVAGAGAGVLLLESLESALARGARIYAEVLGAARQLRRPPRRRQHDRAEPRGRAALHPARARRRRRSTPARGRRDQRPPDRDRRRPARGGLVGGARSSRGPGALPADHVDQVDDRPRARRGRRDRVGRVRADARRAASCTPSLNCEDVHPEIAPYAASIPHDDARAARPRRRW